MTRLQSIREDLAFLDDWDDRYRYLIDLGREMAPLPESAYCDANRVQGCASQVWLTMAHDRVTGLLHLRGDSDALIVKGLVALVIAIFDGMPPEEIIKTDTQAVFADIGLSAHLTSQRANGLASMVARIKAEAARLAADKGPG